MIGIALANRLASRGDEVTVIDNLFRGSFEGLSDKVKTVEGDAAQNIARQVGTDFDVIFHLAGMIFANECEKNPTFSNEANTVTTLRVIELAKQSGAKVVYASSAAVYPSMNYAVRERETYETPKTVYGLQKLTSENYLQISGVKYIALRLFNVFGSDKSEGVIEKFLRAKKEGKDFVVYGEGTARRDYVHIDDVVTAFVAAALHDKHGFSINIGSGTAYSVLDIIEMIDPFAHPVFVMPEQYDAACSLADIMTAKLIFSFEPKKTVRQYIESKLQ